MTYSEFFRQATGKEHFDYQRRLGEEPWPELLDIPTGLGKTAAVVVAWLYKRLNRDMETPRRLIYCLPMRVLVEQTQANAFTWVENTASLFEKEGLEPPGVYLLMGGEVEEEWELYPEKDAILIGTQDMLLSRALMRGYSMSRYKWPVHFGLLHNDAMWVYDEIQLMGAGLPTSTQLEAFRRSFQLGLKSRSMWVSATIDMGWFGTVDFQDTVRKGLATLRIGDEDSLQPEANKRLSAKKTVHSSGITLTDGKKETVADYVRKVAEVAIRQRNPAANTLVIVNNVTRAQAIYKVLKERGVPEEERLLLHGRFCPSERRNIEAKLRTAPPAGGRIVVATQAIEAGVDITSAVLFTEIAPWPSLVQRFGRCNRYGELNGAGGGHIHWLDIDTDQKKKDGMPDQKSSRETALPYEVEDINVSRERLLTTTSASPAELGAAGWQPALTHVLRRKDFIELFNTEPDLSGFDVDISPFIRDVGLPQVHVFWREWEGESPPNEFPSPLREELCPVSIGQAKEMKGYFIRDTVAGQWQLLQGEPRPGMTLLLRAKNGGYDPEVGFDASQRKIPVSVIAIKEGSTPESLAGDYDSIKKALELYIHLEDVENETSTLAERLKLTNEDTRAIGLAGRWHDVGKAHGIFQETMHRCEPEGVKKGMLLAKSPCEGYHSRPYFRHELASMLSWLENHGQTEPVEGGGYERRLKPGDTGYDWRDDFDPDLIAYLIAASHGKVRMSLRAWPGEEEAPEGRRYARGIWEGDILPGFEIGFSEIVSEARLRLDLMELGEGAMGPSWTARVLRLLNEHGPFRLAWLEALVRIADWRASGAEQEEQA